MTTRARRRRREKPIKIHRGWWLAGAVVFVAALPGWDRLVALPVAAGLLFVPLLNRGARQAIPLSWRPRRQRMLRRQAGKEHRSQPPAWMRRVTYAADRYRCLGCGWKRRDGADLQWDHIIPWAMGGTTTLRNGGTLCGRCNRVKSSYWKSDSGKVYYRGFELATDVGEAGKITRREMRARASVLRWIRAAAAYQVERKRGR